MVYILSVWVTNDLPGLGGREKRGRKAVAGTEPPPLEFLHQDAFSRMMFGRHVQLFTTPWTEAHQVSLSFAISQSLLKFMSIASVMLSNHLILCYTLLLLPSVFPSIRIFSSESALCIRWPKYWSFSISPSSEYSWLISFKIDRFDLLAVQELSRVFSSTTVKSINSVVLCLFYGSALTTVHNYHSLDYMDLCQESDVFVF